MSLHVEWRPIEGYGGKYEVSDRGDIRSHVGKGRILRPRTHPFGYKQVGLSQDGVSSSRTVHSLVLEAFVGARPDGAVTRHLDGDPSNNKLSNLAWGTQSENNFDQVRHGTHPRSRQTECLNGHRLELPNLVLSRLARGSRQCFACQGERRLALKQGRPFDPNRANERYRRRLSAA